MKKQIFTSFILPGALEESLPLTPESVAALDNLQQYVEEAKQLLEQANTYAAEIIFVDEMPADGKSGKLYIEKNTNSMYIWDGEAFIQLNNESPVYDEEIIFGGDAFTP